MGGLCPAGEVRQIRTAARHDRIPMEAAPPFGACVWGCGRHNFTKEHVIGRQIVKVLELQSPLTMHLGGWEGRPEQFIRIVLKRRVCKICNETWMRQMDDQFVSVIGDTLRSGTEFDLEIVDQKIVATWATKVALLLELFLHDFIIRNPQVEVGSTFIPSDNLHALRITRTPPDGTTVWIGAIDHSTFHPFSSIGGAILGGPAGPIEGIARGELCGYQSIFNLNDVVFGVRGWTSAYVANPPVGMADPDQTIPGKTVQIWPRIGEVQHCPPSGGQLTPEEIRALAWTDESSPI
jgi:hypothetical protein